MNSFGASVFGQANKSQEQEILEGSAELSEQEQLEQLSRTIGLKASFGRKLGAGQERGLAHACAQLEASVKEALRSLWHELEPLRAEREAKHVATLKALVGDDQQWALTEKAARLLMLYFADLRKIEHLGEEAHYSLAHGAILPAAEQTLDDIRTLEAELATPALLEARAALPVRIPGEARTASGRFQKRQG